ncbi:phytanoyl-CoA dioxygenase family protein, partial [Massariosphaeria phaeospora]
LLANISAVSLKVSGGCIVRGMYRQQTLDSIEDEIRPYIEATRNADSKCEDFVPSSTKMITGLLSKSRTYALSVANNKIWHRVCEHFLKSKLSNSWYGDEARTSVSLPQLSTTVAFSVGPGTKAQGLHRDDDIYHTQHLASAKHHLGRDTMLCLFVAGKKCTKQNGATRIVPGSHLWDFTSPPPSYETSPEKFSRAEMSPGDAFLMLGGVYHGAGSNITRDEERLVYAACATRGYLRQEQNQYLANGLNKIRELPLALQRFAGFGASKPYMGWVDMEEPVKIMNPEVEVGEPEFW